MLLWKQGNGQMTLLLYFFEICYTVDAAYYEVSETSLNNFNN